MKVVNTQYQSFNINQIPCWVRPGMLRITPASPDKKFTGSKCHNTCSGYGVLWVHSHHSTLRPFHTKACCVGFGWNTRVVLAALANALCICTAETGQRTKITELVFQCASKKQRALALKLWCEKAFSPWAAQHVTKWSDIQVFDKRHLLLWICTCNFSPVLCFLLPRGE